MMISNNDIIAFGGSIVENTHVRKGLLYEYTNYLTGAADSFSSAYFGRGNSSNPITALELFHYAFEIFLDWTPDQVLKCLNRQIIDLMKLGGFLDYIDIPPEAVSANNYGYIAHLLYPSVIPYDDTKLVIETYHKVNDGKQNGGLAKYPKGYFDGITGRRRAVICLRELLKSLPVFDSTRDEYAFFASGDGTKALSASNLKIVFRSVFSSPVQFLHEALPDEEKSEFLYHYYDFLYHMRIYKKEKCRYIPKQANSDKNNWAVTKQSFIEVQKNCKEIFEKGKPIPSDVMNGVNRELYARATAQYFGNLAAGDKQGKEKIKTIYEFFFNHEKEAEKLLNSCGMKSYVKKTYGSPFNFIHSVYQNEFWRHFCYFEQEEKVG